MTQRNVLYAADLAGVAVFAVNGALAAMAVGMDLLGIFVLAAVTAIGGGTLRDLCLGRHPVFWVRDAAPLYVIIGAALCAILWSRFLPVPGKVLLIADGLGLALFAMSGAQIAKSSGYAAPIVILMGTMTGSGGGVVRDVLTNQVPLLLRADIYASAAITGIAVLLVLEARRVPEKAAMAIGFLVIIGMRFAAVAFNLRLPTFHL